MKKRHLLVPIVFLVSGYYCPGQTVKQITSKDSSGIAQGKDLVRTVNDLKSGNWLDVATNFFQLGAGDIAGKDHSFSFKANLFALKVKADSTLLIDSNYVKQKFARNFQFNFSLKLDSSYHFNGLKAGFTWAIINKRDSSVVQFITGYTQQFHDLLFRKLNTYYLKSVHLVKDSNGRVLKDRNGHDSLSFNSNEAFLSYRNLNDSLDKMFSNGTFYTRYLPTEFKDAELVALFEDAESAFRDSLDKVARQPLLTLSANGNFDKQKGLLNGGAADLVFLWELFNKKNHIESDIRANFTTKDTTLVAGTVTRNTMNIKGGFNIKLVRNNKSILEFKPNIEYSQVLHGLAPGEKKSNFYAAGELRLRVTDDLWVPLTLKYDLNKKNLLGFLNVSLNMNAFKKT